jgi:hypothetical protein
MQGGDPVQAGLTDRLEVLRWGLDGLERLEHGDEVGVTLQPVTEEETAFVPFDRPRMLQVLARMAVDLDEFTRSPLAPRQAFNSRACHTVPVGLDSTVRSYFRTSYTNMPQQ